jgi:hypothetical protein
MRYRVAFAKRMQSDGESSLMKPSAVLDSNLADGIVAEKVFVEEFEPQASHSQEVLDEDDDFLASSSPEVWEYEVVDARTAEFEEALADSELIMEWDVIDDASGTSADDVSINRATEEERVFPVDGEQKPPSSADQGRKDNVNLSTGAEGGLEDLTVVNANDPSLGLTNQGSKPAEDWAANTGPTRNPIVRPKGNKRPAHATKGS